MEFIRLPTCPHGKPLSGASAIEEEIREIMKQVKKDISQNNSNDPVFGIGYGDERI